jgi:hypothetical protein
MGRWEKDKRSPVSGIFPALTEMRSHKPFRSEEIEVNNPAFPAKTFRYRPLLSAILLIVLAVLILAARNNPVESVGEAAAVSAGHSAVALSVTP